MPVDEHIIGKGDNGTPVRDIVIETRVDVRHIRDALDKISACIADHDTRLRQIEIDGSKAAQENAANVVSLKVRVTNLEALSEVEKAEVQTEKAIIAQQSHWIDSIYTKVGIIAGILLGIAAFLKAWVFQ